MDIPPKGTTIWVNGRRATTHIPAVGGEEGYVYFRYHDTGEQGDATLDEISLTEPSYDKFSDDELDDIGFLGSQPDVNESELDEEYNILFQASQSDYFKETEYTDEDIHNANLLLELSRGYEEAVMSRCPSAVSSQMSSPMKRSTEEEVEHLPVPNETYTDGTEAAEVNQTTEGSSSLQPVPNYSDDVLDAIAEEIDGQHEEDEGLSQDEIQAALNKYKDPRLNFDEFLARANAEIAEAERNIQSQNEELNKSLAEIREEETKELEEESSGPPAKRPRGEVVMSRSERLTRKKKEADELAKAIAIAEDAKRSAKRKKRVISVARVLKQKAPAGLPELTLDDATELIRKELEVPRSMSTPKRRPQVLRASSGASQCTEMGKGLRTSIAFQASSNTVRWLYKNQTKTNLYCYLCSLKIEGEDAHFEHVLAFLSALAKGLIPVRSYKNVEYDLCLLFVQSCLGEWSHHHCNSTCKGEMDLTNNRYRPEKHRGWSDLEPDIPAIKKLLWCIWNSFTANRSNKLQTKLRSIYGTYGNFEKIQLPKIFYRVQMCITVIKCFIDFDKYRKTRAFMVAAGNVSLRTRLNVKLPIGNLLLKHFNDPTKHPVNCQAVRKYVPSVIYPGFAHSGKMYLETPIPPPNRVQTTDIISKQLVHPTHDYTKTHGFSIVQHLDACSVVPKDKLYIVKFNETVEQGWIYLGKRTVHTDEDNRRYKDKSNPRVSSFGLETISETEEFEGGRRSNVKGEQSASSRQTRRQQKQQKKLTRKRRRGPQVTVEIVPYRSARA